MLVSDAVEPSTILLHEDLLANAPNVQQLGNINISELQPMLYSCHYAIVITWRDIPYAFG